MTNSISQDICYVWMTDNNGFLTIYGHRASLLNNNVRYTENFVGSLNRGFTAAKVMIINQKRTRMIQIRGTQIVYIRKALPQSPNPSPFIYHFLTEKVTLLFRRKKMTLHSHQLQKG